MQDSTHDTNVSHHLQKTYNDLQRDFQNLEEINPQKVLLNPKKG